MYSTWNRIQDKYNKDQYKGDKKDVFIGLFLGLTIIGNHIFYWKFKKHLSLDADKNVHIKWYPIRNIDLNIGKNISENDYGAMSKIGKLRKWVLSC